VKLPPDAVYEDVLDLKEFLRCIATEGAANIPGPPVFKREVRVAEETAVPGLLYVRDFLNESEEAELVENIDRGEWRPDLQRRVQHYGWRYDYKSRRVDSSMRLGPLPPWAARLSERLFGQGVLPHLADQVIVNEYVEKQGISKHIDCPECFADGIAMVSLLESWEMLFKEQSGKKQKRAQILGRRSVAIIGGDARYKWAHEIPKRLEEPTGLKRRRRISVTLRKVIVQPK
jgi:alkylated DNA repair dioxygenase AlkB